MSDTTLPRPPAGLDEIVVAIEQALQALEDHPLAGIKVLAPQTIGTTDTRVFHGLGQRPIGYLLLKAPSAVGTLIDGATPEAVDPQNFITLRLSAAPGSVLIGVF